MGLLFYFWVVVFCHLIFEFISPGGLGFDLFLGLWVSFIYVIGVCCWFWVFDLLCLWCV